MIRRGRRSRGRSWTAALGFAVGVGIGMTVLAGGVVSAHDGSTEPLPAVERGLRDVLHTPPSFVREGDSVGLRYDVVCQADAFGKPCAPTGSVFLRSAGERGYRAVHLARSGEATLTAMVDVPAGGLSYYAVIDAAGSSITVPAAGGAAPQRMWAAGDITSVRLGAHVFGRARKPDLRLLSAAWGSGPGALGLLTGRELARVGPSAFDLAPDGSVVVLDQVNDRLATYPTAGGGPRYLPIPFDGGEGDVALGEDGTAYVLDQGTEPVVRSYAASGARVAVAPVSGSGADMLRATSTGAVMHGYPGEMWLPVGGADHLLQPSQQAASARPSRPGADGSEVVVSASDAQAFFALVRGDRVVRAWQVSSGTNLGEIQLAEPYGNGLLVVLRVWTSQRAEFVALVLSATGLASSFSIDAVEWAESAPLGRFKLDESRLFQLRSTSTGAEVVAFDLGGTK
jgi:hypothetical protein